MIKRQLIQAGTTLVPQRVVPAVEEVSVDESEDLLHEEICELDVHQHEAEIGVLEVNVVPTYVKPLSEKVVEVRPTIWYGVVCKPAVVRRSQPADSSTKKCRQTLQRRPSFNRRNCKRQQ